MVLCEDLYLTGFTSLFTCGGLCDNNCGAEIEVTDLPFLDGSQPSRTCSEMPQMPSVKSSHIAMWDDGGKSVLYCGGYNSESKRCLKYYNNEWINLGDILLHERGESSAVELSDGRYWISGGMVGYELLNLPIVPLTRTGLHKSRVSFTFYKVRTRPSLLGGKSGKNTKCYVCTSLLWTDRPKTCLAAIDIGVLADVAVAHHALHTPCYP